ncbi:MAG: nucleotidyltransferase [Gemmatimonas sp.]|nr:nucleotidyltransferase [Gemmatimonas sp.]
MERPGFEIDLERIAELCRRHHIIRLALFGSILRHDFGPESDVDMLVEFEPGHTPGFAFFSIQEELTAILGRPVDLRTPDDLSRYFRNDVVRTARLLYAA